MKERDTIRTALRESAGILVVGEAGSGRTRLMAEAVTVFDRPGTVVHQAAGAGAGVPFGALAHLLPGSREPVNPVRWAAELLCGAAPRPLVLAVDDAHLLDGRSAATIAYLVAHRGARVVLTTLTGAAVPPVLLSLWTDGGVSRLDLAPLPVRDTARLLGAVLGGEVEMTTARSLWHTARGNVRLLLELAHSQSFTQVDGRVRWSGELLLTPRLRQMAEAAMGELDDSERELLELVAAGGPVALDTLTRLTSPGAVERLEARALITVHAHPSGVTVRLAHPLHAWVIRSWSTPMATRNRLRRVHTTHEGEGTVLSARELEIARLASWNLTNREIADWLTLSHRTVGNHLHNVYTKLGVNRRLDLVPLLT
ncbi:LuxR C-terminal-related transcriptional regulator [Sphaerisporangium sp. B11E5]|uniref:helix-turn-helix transcriptional regulator n=1 Tax=Sphaerisporangium sp. B11E5 TaxID=3153563 RepID=UPI00325D7141